MATQEDAEGSELQQCRVRLYAGRLTHRAAGYPALHLRDFRRFHRTSARRLDGQTVEQVQTTLREAQVVGLIRHTRPSECSFSMMFSDKPKNFAFPTWFPPVVRNDTDSIKPVTCG